MDWKSEIIDQLMSLIVSNWIIYFGTTITILSQNWNKIYMHIPSANVLGVEWKPVKVGRRPGTPIW